MRRKGFTLIELLVVIAIIAILAAILYPVFARAREKAYQATCQSHLKQYAMAIIMYCGDYDDFGPYQACGWSVPKRLEFTNYGPRDTSPVYTCKKCAYTLSYWRGGNCKAGPAAYTEPWTLGGHPSGNMVKHPEDVILVADARSGHDWIRDPPGLFFYDIDGRMTPAHGAINNAAYCDGHVKGRTPQWLKEDIAAGDVDANGNGIGDGEEFGYGAWWWWWR
jgi:prepilin-type N-terminal cleavage/methylation domain-containing protein/prepilin-type processing-associated H-X9-DG protein